MLNKEWEYLILLLLFNLVGISLFLNKFSLLKTGKNVLGMLIFFVYSTLLEIVALNLGWWEFNDEHICGIKVFNIPLEEYILFISFYCCVIIVWDYLDNELG